MGILPYQAEGGLIAVKDLSATGLKFQINSQHNCTVGDVIIVEFHLDDAQRTLVKKKVIVRNIIGQNIGTEYASTEALDKALGFYLFS
jgi:hypothetical protein